MCLQNWASETEILFMTHPLKTDICAFSKTANDRQVYSGKLLQSELQISQLKLYIYHKNKNHFELGLSTLRPNNYDMNSKSDIAESMMKSSVLREFSVQINS